MLELVDEIESVDFRADGDLWVVTSDGVSAPAADIDREWEEMYR